MPLFGYRAGMMGERCRRLAAARDAADYWRRSHDAFRKLYARRAGVAPPAVRDLLKGIGERINSLPLRASEPRTDGAASPQQPPHPGADRSDPKARPDDQESRG